MQHLSKYRWHIAQVVVVVVIFPAFFTWAPWLTAVPMSEVPSAAAALLPVGCPAASVGHGTWSCQWHGTVESNPWGFAICSAIILGGWAFLIISSLFGRGFRVRRGK